MADCFFKVSERLSKFVVDVRVVIDVGRSQLKGYSIRGNAIFEQFQIYLFLLLLSLVFLSFESKIILRVSAYSPFKPSQNKSSDLGVREKQKTDFENLVAQSETFSYTVCVRL